MTVISSAKSFLPGGELGGWGRGADVFGGLFTLRAIAVHEQLERTLSRLTDLGEIIRIRSCFLAPMSSYVKLGRSRRLPHEVVITRVQRLRQCRHVLSAPRADAVPFMKNSDLSADGPRTHSNTEGPDPTARTRASAEGLRASGRLPAGNAHLCLWLCFSRARHGPAVEVPRQRAGFFPSSGPHGIRPVVCPGSAHSPASARQVTGDR